MPEIWEMIVENRVAAYNVPSVILFDMHREAAANRPGVMTMVRMKTFAEPVRQGCAMNDLAAENAIINRVQFNGDTWLHYPDIIPTVAILRATMTDDRGT